MATGLLHKQRIMTSRENQTEGESGLQGSGLEFRLRYHPNRERVGVM